MKHPIKNRLFRYAVIVLITAMAYFAIASYENKQSCAIGLCINIELVAFEFIGGIAAILGGDISALSALSFVGQYLDNIFNMVQYYIDFYTDSLQKEAEETHEMMQKVARQDRESNISVVDQLGSLKESSAISEKTTLFQQSQVDTLSSRFPAPSVQVCKNTMLAVRQNQHEIFTDFENSINRESTRRRINGINPPAEATQNGYSVEPSNAYGPLVYNRALMRSQQFQCFRDEHLGNLSLGYHPCALSGSDYGSSLWDVSIIGSYASSYTSPSTNNKITTVFNNSHLLALLYPPPSLTPFSRSIEKDTETQNAYMSYHRALARTQLNEEILNQLSSKTMAFESNDQVYNALSNNTDPELRDIVSSGQHSPCYRSLQIARQTYSEAYGHPLLGSAGENPYNADQLDQCPSESQMEHVSVMSVSSSSNLTAILTSKEGNQKQSALYASILRQTLEFDIYQKDALIALQMAIHQLGETQSINAPVDSIGRGP